MELKETLKLDDNKKDYLVKSIIPELKLNIVERDDNFEQPLLVIAAASVEMFDSSSNEWKAAASLNNENKKIKY